MAQTFEQLKAGAEKIKLNELPESNTHGLVGEQLLQMATRMEDDDKTHKESLTKLETETNGKLSELRSEYTTKMQYVLEGVTDRKYKIVKTTYSAGFLRPNGDTNPSSAAKVSDYIDVVGKIIKISQSPFSKSAWTIACFYDENRNFLFSVSPNDYTQIIPSGSYPLYDIVVYQHLFNPTVKYGKFTISASVGDLKECPFEYGTSSEEIEKRIESNGKFVNTSIAELVDDTTDQNYAVVQTNWTPNKYLDFSNNLQDSGAANVSDYVDVVGKKVKMLTNMVTTWALAFFYDENKQPLFYVKCTDYTFWQDSATEYEFIIYQHLYYPKVKYARFTTPYPQNVYITDAAKGIKEKRIARYANENAVGYLSNDSINDADICYIPMYGQSYTTTNDGGYKLTTTFDDGLYMHGAVFPIGKGDDILRPMATGNNGEFIISDFGNAFIKLVKRYYGYKGEMLLQSYGMGSRSVLELQKNNGYSNPEYHTFETTLEPGVKNAVAAAKKAGKKIICPFFLFLQGESDIVIGRHTGATPDSQCNGDKKCYKTNLLILKEQVQNLIMTETKQTKKPIMFVYNPGNQTFFAPDSGISQAVTELAIENDDIWTMGPYYQVTSMGAHPSPDGRRWLAQKLAECVFDVQMRGIERMMYVKKCEVEKNRLRVYIKTPTPPLKIDTYTVKMAPDYGFKLTENGREISISKVEVYSDFIDITASETLVANNLKLGYCDKKGYGNIRDSNMFSPSDVYKSNNNGDGEIVYTALTENGETLIGKKYPLCNWLPAFGINVRDYIND